MSDVPAIGIGRKMLVADLFCGAGGSSTGALLAFQRLGLEMDLVCANHWATSIETHWRNHPQARHYCQDISTVRPHIVVPEGYLDLLMASPTCTHHSPARGGKPTSDQQRSDPWHIITWLTELRVKRMIIENVWEFVKWGPVDPVTMRPVKEREGEYFRAWIDTVRKLGATSIEWPKLNAADYGGATTRQRFFAFFRFDGKPLLWPVATHAKRSDAAAKGLQPWRPARDIIDWSIKGRSIFGRKVPLAPKTLARILAGAQKFFWPEILIGMIVAELQRSLVHALRYSFARRHTARADLRMRHRKRVRLYAAWLRKARADQVQGGAGEAVPMLVTLRNNADGRSLSAPVPTLAANGTHVGLAEPIILSTGSGAPRASSQPLPTCTTGGAGSDDPGCARPMLAEPIILNRHGENGYVRAHTVDDPAPTADCRGAGYLVEPFMLSRHGDGAPRSTGEPTPTQVAKHSHVLISPYYGTGSGETCRSAEEPLPVATTKARFGMVVPITHDDRANRARDVDLDPLATLTTANRGELALVSAETAVRYDVLFRMLEPHELAGAMGFVGYRFAGNKTEQVKQIGNAVSVEQMEANVYAIMQDEVDAAPEFLEAAE